MNIQNSHGMGLLWPKPCVPPWARRCRPFPFPFPSCPRNRCCRPRRRCHNPWIRRRPGCGCGPRPFPGGLRPLPMPWNGPCRPIICPPRPPIRCGCHGGIQFNNFFQGGLNFR